jgi:hypothetical protein
MRFQRTQGKGQNRPKRAGSEEPGERKSSRTTRGRGRGRGRYSSRYDDPFTDGEDTDDELVLSDEDE